MVKDDNARRASRYPATVESLRKVERDLRAKARKAGLFAVVQCRGGDWREECSRFGEGNWTVRKAWFAPVSMWCHVLVEVKPSAVDFSREWEAGHHDFGKTNGFGDKFETDYLEIPVGDGTAWLYQDLWYLVLDFNMGKDDAIPAKVFGLKTAAEREFADSVKCMLELEGRIADGCLDVVRENRKKDEEVLAGMAARDEIRREFGDGVIDGSGSDLELRIEVS